MALAIGLSQSRGGRIARINQRPRSALPPGYTPHFRQVVWPLFSLFPLLQMQHVGHDSALDPTVPHCHDSIQLSPCLRLH